MLTNTFGVFNYQMKKGVTVGCREDPRHPLRHREQLSASAIMQQIKDPPEHLAARKRLFSSFHSLEYKGWVSLVAHNDIVP